MSKSSAARLLFLLIAMFALATLTACGSGSMHSSSTSTTSAGSNQPAGTSPGSSAPPSTTGSGSSSGGSGSSSGSGNSGGGPTAQGGTYIYARVSGTQVAGYRLNADGSLTALNGSPFTVPGGHIAATGSHLISAITGQFLVYAIDRATGALTSQSQTAADVVSDFSMAAQGGFVYDVATTSTGRAIYAFSIAQNGTLTAVPGSPYASAAPCADLCADYWPDSITISAKYLVIGSGGGHNAAGAFDVFARQSNGALQHTSAAGADTQLSVSLHPSDRFLYSVNSGDQSILVSTIDANGQAKVEQDYLPPSQDSFMSVANDPAGSLLVGATSNGSLVSFFINSDGTITPASRAATSSNNGPQVVFDPSGHFVILAESTDLSVYDLDRGKGAMTKIASVAGSFGKPVVATF